MIEIPEAVSLAGQVVDRLIGRTIRSVVSGQSPHKFAWYYGDTETYQSLAAGLSISGAEAVGGMLEIHAGDIRFLFSEGVSPRYHESGALHPKKHQFLIEFTDKSFLSATVHMYGGMGVFREDGLDNEYYIGARHKPSPLSADFDREHFNGILDAAGAEKLSAKALLATEQRIPGLGNGVLQDVLFNARINPRTKVQALEPESRDRLFHSVKDTLRTMADAGGRDTELDLFGQSGRYKTLMSRNTVGSPCAGCGEIIAKASYMGGSVYYCPQCQPV